jgi:hypothetical protein
LVIMRGVSCAHSISLVVDRELLHPQQPILRVERQRAEMEL